MRSLSLSSVLLSVFLSLHINACSSQEPSTEETVQATDEQAPAEPTEKDKALADASSSDFTEPSEVQLDKDAAPASIAAEPAPADVPAVATPDSETPTPVDAVDNTIPAPEAPVAPDLTSETGLGSVNAAVSVFFAKASARVTKEYRNQLKDVAEKLKSDRSMKITLSGHCDNRGSAAFNRRLAMKRARAVKAVLVRMGVKGKQVTIGSAQLASSGSTEEEHAQNRRVEVEFQ